MTELRPYQRAAIDSVLDYWQAGEAGNPLVDLATGTGKSIVLATLMRELLESWPLMRILCLVHVRELVAQNYQQLVRLWPQAPAGINSAGLGRRDSTSPILFASIQSVFRKPHLLGRRDLVLVDEAHLLPKGGDGMYHQLLSGLRETSPDLRVMGCTATPYRLDSGRLDRGEGRFFDRIVYTYGIAEGVEDGFLSPLVSKGMKSEINVSNVGKRGGEFIPGALEAEADKYDLVKGAVDEILTHGSDRKSWLVFCAGVDHAHHVCEEIRSRGIRAETVTGNTPKAERDEILRGFKAGYIRAVCNMSVLTTGFDAPNTDLIAMLRPTLSAGLYVQMLGRGTRLAPTKKNCLVLDFSGNVRRHGPVDMIDVGGGRKKGTPSTDVAVTVDSVRAKDCPNCGSLQYLRATQCRDCGYEWPVEPKHDAKADDASVMSGRTKDGWIPVRHVSYYQHRKRGNEQAPPTLRVAYGIGIMTVNQWWCFSHPHGSMPQRRAAGFWLEAGGSLPIPESVDEALRRQDELRQAVAIRYRQADSGFNEVTGRKYAAAGEMVA